VVAALVEAALQGDSSCKSLFRPQIVGSLALIFCSRSESPEWRVAPQRWNGRTNGWYGPFASMTVMAKAAFRCAPHQRQLSAVNVLCKVARTAQTGPKETSGNHLGCCSAARQSGHSCILQHFCWLKRRCADGAAIPVSKANDRNYDLTILRHQP
jgi:hypothetical protein